MSNKRQFNRINRRDFLKCATTAVAAPSLAPAIARAQERRDRPNLLFLWTDEQRADTMAAYGNAQIKTPNLNALCDESFVFRNAYVSQPVCTPARSTVMTGLWPHQSGCTMNNVALPKNIRAFPEIVDDPEYRTGYFGKWHLGDEIFPQHGFEEWRSIEDGYRRYYGEDRDLDARSSYHHFLEDLGYKPDTRNGDFSRGFAARLPIEHSKTKYLENETCDFLRRRQNEPFMLYVNFLEPHMPFFGPLDDLYDPEKIPLPKNFHDPLEDNEPKAYRELRQRYLEEGWDEHDLNTEAGWRNLIAKYWGLVTQVDRSVGVILDTLERLRLADNTVVVYTSEHGDMMGSHKMIAKTVMYEESAKVPWIVRAPKASGRRRVIQQPVSHIDMVPTLLDLMDVMDPTDDMDGQSLRPLFERESVEEDHVYIQWNPAGLLQDGRNPRGRLRIEPDEPQNATRTVVSPDGWKLCINTHDHNQLFHLKEDPGETANLYAQPQHAKIQQRLTQRIRTWQERVNDDLAI